MWRGASYRSIPENAASRAGWPTKTATKLQFAAFAGLSETNDNHAQKADFPIDLVKFEAERRQINEPNAPEELHTTKSPAKSQRGWLMKSPKKLSSSHNNQSCLVPKLEL